MTFDYEQAIWGKNTASTKIGDPTSIRFRRLQNNIKDLPSGAKVLEIGCGAGQFIRGVKKLRADLVCYGSDISSQAVQFAVSLNDGVNYKLQTDVLPFEDNFFDVVFILDVLEHAENWREILSETKRVLKNNGSIYIFVPCEGAKTSIWNWLRFIGVGKDLTKKYAGHINYFKPSEVLGEIKNLGFRYSVSFSENLLGQLLGIAVFFAMDKKAKQAKSSTLNNESFFENTKENQLIRWLKTLVNSLVFVESYLFQRIPSPNLHIQAKKP